MTVLGLIPGDPRVIPGDPRTDPLLSIADPRAFLSTFTDPLTGPGPEPFRGGRFGMCEITDQRAGLRAEPNAATLSGDHRPLPPRIRQQLLDSGAIGTDRLSRKARPRRCGKCGRLTIAGMIDAFPAHCDPFPLNQLGELNVLIAGHLTFRLFQVAGSNYELAFRWAESVRGSPAGTAASFDVLGAHRCAVAVPLEWTAPSVLPVPPDAGQLPDRPPF